MESFFSAPLRCIIVRQGTAVQGSSRIKFKGGGGKGVLVLSVPVSEPTIQVREDVLGNLLLFANILLIKYNFTRPGCVETTSRKGHIYPTSFGGRFPSVCDHIWRRGEISGLGGKPASIQLPAYNG